MALNVYGDLSLLELAVFSESDADAFCVDEIGILVARRTSVQPDLLLMVLAWADLQLLNRQVELDTQLLFAQEAAILIHVVLDNVFED